MGVAPTPVRVLVRVRPGRWGRRTASPPPPLSRGRSPCWETPASAGEGREVRAPGGGARGGETGGAAVYAVQTAREAPVDDGGGGAVQRSGLGAGPSARPVSTRPGARDSSPSVRAPAPERPAPARPGTRTRASGLFGRRAPGRHADLGRRASQGLQGRETPGAGSGARGDENERL